MEIVMATFVRVQGTNFIRDIDSMGLTNRDAEGLEEYKLKRKLIATQKEEINKIKTNINNIKEDMSEIKQLMQKLLEKS